MSGLIVHEWLEPLGGAEKVVEQLADIFPEELILAAWNDAPDRFDSDRVLETWISKTPLRRHKALAIPFMLQAWRSLTFSEIDWVLCSSHLFAHHASFRSPNQDVRKYVYAYTPARYIWNPELDQRGDTWFARAASRSIQKIDRRRAQEATSVVAISQFVRERIQQHWERSCDVIYPPVDVKFYTKSHMADLTGSEQATLDSLPSDYVLGASRFIPYKRLDQVIELGEAAGVPVVLAGGGPEEGMLRGLAAETKVPVIFINNPSRAMLRELYVRAMSFIFPAVEDFGIMPVEAMAAGTPVIAGRIGGAAETVVGGRTGRLIDFRSRGEAKDALQAVQSYLPEDCVRRAHEFDNSIFRMRILNWIGS
ncbi:glycosyltransferase [Pseudarthrobacter phenanthrenivorans]|uniref:glycosyltransferase n=1 Tax=Pseudarthrobacter phenanthrenivorans TaxID=361575 RepID=UPI002F351F03